jgi:hypothetical protein
MSEKLAEIRLYISSEMAKVLDEYSESWNKEMPGVRTSRSLVASWMLWKHLMENHVLPEPEINKRIGRGGGGKGGGVLGMKHEKTIPIIKELPISGTSIRLFIDKDKLKWVEGKVRLTNDNNYCVKINKASWHTPVGVDYMISTRLWEKIL